MGAGLASMGSMLNNNQYRSANPGGGERRGGERPQENYGSN